MSSQHLKLKTKEVKKEVQHKRTSVPKQDIIDTKQDIKQDIKPASVEKMPELPPKTAGSVNFLIETSEEKELRHFGAKFDNWIGVLRTSLLVLQINQERVRKYKAIVQRKAKSRI